MVLGSVVQIYCTASNESLTTPPDITWMKASPTPEPLNNDPAHIRIRTSSNVVSGSATSVLTIDFFTDQDDGTYHCLASIGNDNEASATMEFAGWLQQYNYARCKYQYPVYITDCSLTINWICGMIT